LLGCQGVYITHGGLCCRPAAACVHVAVRHGGGRGGGVPALEGGGERRVPWQGQGTLPGRHLTVTPLAVTYVSHYGPMLLLQHFYAPAIRRMAEGH